MMMKLLGKTEVAEYSEHRQRELDENRNEFWEIALKKQSESRNSIRDGPSVH